MNFIAITFLFIFSVYLINTIIGKDLERKKKNYQDFYGDLEGFDQYKD